MRWAVQLKITSGPLQRRSKKYVWIKEAEVLRNTLHYNNERVVSFGNFLTNIQSMFTGYYDMTTVSEGLDSKSNPG